MCEGEGKEAEGGTNHPKNKKQQRSVLLFNLKKTFTFSFQFSSGPKSSNNGWALVLIYLSPIQPVGNSKETGIVSWMYCNAGVPLMNVQRLYGSIVHLINSPCRKELNVLRLHTSKSWTLFKMWFAVLRLIFFWSKHTWDNNGSQWENGICHINIHYILLCKKCI